MQYLILTLLLTLTLVACRCIRRDPRCYRWTAWSLSLLLLGAMTVQEVILLRSGLLTPATGLPLHLCSLMGILTPVMLLGRSRFLRAASLLIGVPGAALALLFPAILPTPWPRLTALAFHALHAGLVCAPLPVLATGWTPRPADALRAGAVLLTAAALAMIVNPLTGGNYLFLAAPIAGTPLAWLGQWGIHVYRALLGLLAGLVLAVGAGLTALRRTFPG